MIFWSFGYVTVNSIACLKKVPVTLLAVLNIFPLHNFISYIVLLIPLVSIGTISKNSHHFQKNGVIFKSGDNFISTKIDKFSNEVKP